MCTFDKNVENIVDEFLTEKSNQYIIVGKDTRGVPTYTEHIICIVQKVCRHVITSTNVNHSRCTLPPS